MGGPDVIIVGGGVIGCATAYYLAKMKIKALVIEAEEIGAGASSRNGGGVRQSARDPREMPLALHAVRNLWPGLAEELGVDMEYTQAGNLRFGKTPAHLKTLENIVNQGLALGLDLKMISQAEVKEICPFVSDEVIGAIFCPTDGHANPMLTTLAYYRKARELGARFITGEKVEAVTRVKGRVVGVRTNAGSYPAPQVMLANGYEARPLTRALGIDIPMQKILIEALVTEEQPAMFPQMIGTAPADFYGHQARHGSFVFGGSAGLEPFGAPETVPVTRSITAPSICRAILGYFPFMKTVNLVRTWAGYKDQMYDLIPVLGRVEEVPGFSLACGFTGHGFGIAPAVGLLLAEMLADRDTYLPMDAFRYDRFKPKL